MDRWKAEVGRGRKEKQREEERRSEKRKSQKKEDADVRKDRKLVRHVAFQVIRGSRGSQSRLAKAAGAEPSGQMRDDRLHASVARTVRIYKVHHSRSTFGCRKSGCFCGVKHIAKSKCTKHSNAGPLVEVDIFKK